MRITFKIGDLVRLKSGGDLVMTVTKVSGLSITVVWAKSTKSMGEKQLPYGCLELAKKNEISIITGMTVT